MNNIITPQTGNLYAPRRHSPAGGLNILHRQWRDLLLPGPRSGLRGRIKVDILDARTKRVIKPGRWQHNLVLDCGLDMPFSNAYADCFLYGHLSTDTASPVSTDTSMAGWAKQTNSYGSGDGATTCSGDTITFTRSFVFTAETSTVTYTKFYSSHASGSSATPFNEVLLAESITLSADQQAKVTMSLELTLTPHTTAAIYSNDVINGVSGSTGEFRIISARSVGSYYYLSTIDSSGSTNSTLWACGGFLEPSYAPAGNCQMDVSSQSTLSAAADLLTAGSYSSVIATWSNPSATLSAYSSGSFNRTKTFLAGLDYLNGSGIQSMFVGRGTGSPAWQFMSDVAFAKLNTQKLSMNFTFSVGRSD